VKSGEAAKISAAAILHAKETRERIETEIRAKNMAIYKTALAMEASPIKTSQLKPVRIASKRLDSRSTAMQAAQRFCSGTGANIVEPRHDGLNDDLHRLR
jgi:hypothetical protein